ncbi:MAG: AAA family ATPase, partial [Blastocatellia bacterium]|nr:AAA family ATPase [Blastocatellia bacterium]
ERKILRFDMSEFMEEHSLSKMIGSPPGYIGHEEGGRLTDAVRQSPYSVILFDEVEKAHRKIFDIFLQIFDEGRLTDSHGRTVDFHNTVIIMTTNLLSKNPNEEDKPKMGFLVGREDAKQQNAKLVQEQLRTALLPYFRPELINRIDQTIKFNFLGQNEMRAIIDKFIFNVQKLLYDKNITLVLSEAARDLLMVAGFKSEYGAREMERVIDNQIIHPLANALLDGSIKYGDTVYINESSDKESLVLTTNQRKTLELKSILTVEVAMNEMFTHTEEREVAMLLLDIVYPSSTSTNLGDTLFSQNVTDLHNALRQHLKDIDFLKCTGDGFLVICKTVPLALEIAEAFRTLPKNESIKIRLMIHYGLVKISAEGDPFGRDVHKLFRIEEVEDSDRLETAPFDLKLPPPSRIRLTKAAIDHLPEQIASRFGRVGLFRLKAFEEPEEIWGELATSHLI